MGLLVPVPNPVIDGRQVVGGGHRVAGTNRTPCVVPRD